MAGWLGHVLILRVGSDGSVRGELELADGGNIGGRGEQLEGGLLLRVSNIDGDLGGTEVLQGGSRIVGILNPLDRLLLTGWPRGSGSGGGSLHSFGVSELAGCCEKARKTPRKWWRKPKARRRPKPTGE
jgi:hypothetical protein